MRPWRSCCRRKVRVRDCRRRWTRTPLSPRTPKRCDQPPPPAAYQASLQLQTFLRHQYDWLLQGQEACLEGSAFTKDTNQSFCIVIFHRPKDTSARMSTFSCRLASFWYTETQKDRWAIWERDPRCACKTFCYSPKTANVGCFSRHANRLWIFFTYLVDKIAKKSGPKILWIFSNILWIFPFSARKLKTKISHFFNNICRFIRQEFEKSR